LARITKWELFSIKKKLYVIENLICLIPDEDVNANFGTGYQCHINDDEYDICVILANMSPKLQM
jgi:hypothetical protein